ncbi:SURF1 family protein [Micrococcus flavus]|uniref:SURF1-like protein n=1 Tax=Micrococcus flavus TaxID=384602 RepID=A0A4Y8X345_9MICC|nr:SURF1 family protein [Micrococcus flavus]MBB4882213.1 cytochrome oxidase assembly protein ShyY1 [Micrococcus flavus]TFI03867.1 SURF1 family protein [Micrococcus flavus]GGK51194.1 SURF1-like protein [Micrococcus flavus]
MLRTALKPVWLLSLLLALVAATVFVLLSRWQFQAAETNAPPPRSQTENAVPLTSHLRPGEPLTAAAADQVVTARGEFLPGTDVLVGPRLSEGREGWWTVTAFRVADAPGAQTIPVVRGWSAAADVVDPAPAGEVTVAGRLLPPDGPLPRSDDAGDTAGRPAYATLSPGQLVNVWDVPSYAAFVAAFAVTDAAGAEVGARAAEGGLEPVWVAPQPEETQVIWLNVFYGVEWVLFAGFALFLWWRFVRDDHQRELREAELDEEWAARWRAEELARRREEARLRKEEARRAYAAAHRTQDGPEGPRKESRP